MRQYAVLAMELHNRCEMIWLFTGVMNYVVNMVIFSENHMSYKPKEVKQWQLEVLKLYGQEI